MTEKEIFLEAAEIADHAKREAFLQEAVAGNAVLRDRVDALLKSYFSAGRFLESAAAGPESSGSGGLTAALDSPPLPDGPGTIIGPYKLLQRLGEGGMGAVYLAEQERPVKRRVALKLIKAGFDSRQVIARFEQERQALALMDHPHIAKVLDAGATAGGRPYFVMELVKGIPLTKYCDRERLTPLERLKLFIPVCHAIQHAHQKGIIHRDLKPSNVLVALFDGHPVPKVIDFGVAKATTQKLTERTMFTEVGSIIGTLEYMAPEQAELNNLDIDTRADIYSLGVILYELLTGSPPFTAEELRGAAFTEMLRLIREVEPPKPSTRLSSSAELPAIAALRRLEPKGLTSTVSGELDWIVMKCLDKERGRRYETAGALALDIERHLSDEPVLAGPPSRRYRLRKFVRRNKRWIATAAAFALLLVLAAAASGVLALRALKAERAVAAEAEAARSNFDLAHQAVDKYLNVLAQDPELHQADLTALRKRLLETAVPFYEDLAKRQPGNAAGSVERARALVRLAEVRRDLGDFETALRDLEQAREISEPLVGERPENAAAQSVLALGLSHLGWVLKELGRLEPAEDALRRAVAILARLKEERSGNFDLGRRLAEDELYLGQIAAQRGDLAAAEEGYRRAQAAFKELSAGDPAPRLLGDLARSHEALGTIFFGRGRNREAAEEFSKAVSIHAEASRRSPNNRSYKSAEAHAHELVADAFTNLNEHAAADKEFRLALESHEEVVRGFPSRPGYRADLATTRLNFGLFCLNFHRFDEAQVQLKRAIGEADEAVRLAPGVTRYAVAASAARANLGLLQRNLGNHAEAEKTLREAVALYQRLVDLYPGTPNYRVSYAATLQILGGALGYQQKYQDSVATFRKAAETLRGLAGEFPAAVAHRQALVSTLTDLCMASTDRPEHEYEEAFRAIREAEPLAKALVEEHPAEPVHRKNLGQVYSHLGKLHWRTGRPAESREAYDRCVAIREKLARDFPDRPEYQSELATTYSSIGGALRTQEGQVEKGLEWLEKACSVLEALLAAHPQDAASRLMLRNAWGNRAWALTRLGRNAEAAAAWKRTNEINPDETLRPLYAMGEALTSALAAGRWDEAVSACGEFREHAEVKEMTLYDMACVCAQAASALPPDAALREKLSAEAVACLKEAVSRGYRNAAFIQADSDLDLLRNREDFQAILRGLEAAGGKRSF